MTRREQLESMLAESPDDTFLKYALAMEWESEEEFDKSLALHRELIAGTPPYVPSFFMMGQQLANLDRIEEARQAIEAGIEQAHQQGDAHAASEMTLFLTTLE
jgi:tetratricopeptide (TPR) repeat protein